MTRRLSKYAVVLNLSVSKETRDRVIELKIKWSQISHDKFDKLVNISEIGQLALDVGLEVLESLPRPRIEETLAKDKVSDYILSVQVKKARKALKEPRTISNMTDDQIENMISGKSENDEE
jgi:hypothetical protein